MSEHCSEWVQFGITSWGFPPNGAFTSYGIYGKCQKPMWKMHSEHPSCGISTGKLVEYFDARVAEMR